NIDSTVVAFAAGLGGLAISGGVSVINIGTGMTADSDAGESSAGAQDAIDNVQSGDSGGYTTSTRYVPSDGTVTLFNGDTVDAANGKRYEFTPQDETAGVDLTTQNYASSGDWSEVGNTRDFTNAAHATTASNATLSTNQTVDIVTGYSLTGSGVMGHRYAYLGADNLTVSDWANVDFSDKTVWQDLGQRQKFLDQSADSRSDKKAAVIARGAAAADIENDPVTLVSAGQSSTNAYIGLNATVTATNGDIEVKANDNIDLGMVVGSGAVSTGVGVGGAVAVATLGNETSAYVDINTTLVAGDDITIKADYINDIEVESYGGSAGAVGLGAQVGVIVDDSNQTAYSAGSDITSADSITVEATANRNISIKAKGVAAGLLAAGASIGSTSIGGETKAYLGQFTQVGQGGNVGSLSVNAESNLTVDQNIWTVSAGIGAASVNVGSVTFDSNVYAYIDRDSRIDSQGTVTVTADVTPDIDSTIHGVSAGGLAVGAS
ncbi:MAG: hypothetical protein ACPG3T_05270, partial [Pseudomonadales bacterium]